jgi:hypothetical protein
MMRKKALSRAPAVSNKKISKDLTEREAGVFAYGDTSATACRMPRIQAAETQAGYSSAASNICSYGTRGGI